MTSDPSTDPSTPAAASTSLERYRPLIESLLRDIIRHGNFRLSFTFRRPEPSEEDVETPEMVVDFSGPDADLLLEAHAELLNAFEYVVLRAVRLEEGLFPKISFDCQDWHRLRVEELKLMAQVAADRVRDTGSAFPLGPMNARERRIIHLALRDCVEVRTESQGQGPERRVVIMPASPPPRHR
ncbi:MAG TPA: R3H domain-containing nucleic acid-binding protein [Terriglobia bacterium]